MKYFPHLSAVVLACLVSAVSTGAATPERPNIILVMADDMGYGQTGYYDHPLLKTPNLDAMAANGLRFDRFYAGASNCSPTRATVMTGRSNDRTGVFDHGYPLRLQEKTVAQALRDAGYATGHFGKWHLNGLRGPGVPILAEDSHNPGAFGFDTWLSVTNFFDLNPILSRNGEFEEFTGDSSEIVIDEALNFITKNAATTQPSFTVVWYGTPHSPFVALEKDLAQFPTLKGDALRQHAELVAMDRSIGTLRARLRELDIADNTLFWFCSDNGGLPKIKPSTVGDLRGFKNSFFEGGLRVPAIIEWPAVITAAKITDHLACTTDIFPTLAEIADVPVSAMGSPLDGISLLPLIAGKSAQRSQPLHFRHHGLGAIIDSDGQYKLLTQTLDAKKPRFELYDLNSDHRETTDIAESHPEIVARLKTDFLNWNSTVEASIAGKDYPGGQLDPDQPERRFWTEVDGYQPYFDAWKTRPEYESRIK